MRMLLLIAAAALLLLAACGVPSGVGQMQSGAATAAAELQETAVALAPSVQIDIDALQETAEALAPTLQAAAPEIRATLEALATEQPVDGVSARQTIVALAGGGEVPEDIPLPEQRQLLVTSPTRVTYTTQTGYGAILELYQSEMPERGWEALPESVTTPQASQLRYRKGGRTATVVIAKLVEGTTVDVSIE
jgi:hypothetical protein